MRYDEGARVSLFRFFVSPFPPCCYALLERSLSVVAYRLVGRVAML